MEILEYMAVIWLLYGCQIDHRISLLLLHHISILEWDPGDLGWTEGEHMVFSGSDLGVPSIGWELYRHSVIADPRSNLGITGILTVHADVFA